MAFPVVDDRDGRSVTAILAQFVLASITSGVIGSHGGHALWWDMTRAGTGAGQILREWRQRRRYSQLELALEVEMSQRHLSFLEAGRSMPSRDMVLRLSECLKLPLREQNALLLAAGFAPAYGERALAAPEFEAARGVIDRLLQGHEPHPALAVDRRWALISANRAVNALTRGVSKELLTGDVNVLRLSLHPDGLASRIINFKPWRSHILARLAHDIEISADPSLVALLDELRSYPTPMHALGDRDDSAGKLAVAIPLVLDSSAGRLEFLSTTTVFGTAVDVTLADIVIESFFPANVETARAMAKLLADGG
jgi:transcriptional regulator with XRE-family HTH domain